MYGVTWENGRVALSKDLIFGLVVMTEDGWWPVNQLDAEDREMVWGLAGNHPGMPFRDDLARICGKV